MCTYMRVHLRIMVHRNQVKTWPNREWIEIEIHIMHILSFKGQYILLNTHMENVLFVYKLLKYIGLPVILTHATKRKKCYCM